MKKCTRIVGLRQSEGIPSSSLPFRCSCCGARKATPAAGARHIQVDFGFNSSDPSQSENDPQGESWNPICDTTPGAATTSCILDYTTPASTAISTANVPIGFDVKLGSNIFSQVHLNKNGVLTFDVDVAHPVLLGAFAPESTLSALASLIGAKE